jgi:hypothetical protein
VVLSSAVVSKCWPALEDTQLESYLGEAAHDTDADTFTVQPEAGKRFVSLCLLVADTYPDMLQGASSDLLKRRSGKAVLTVERW